MFANCDPDRFKRKRNVYKSIARHCLECRGKRPSTCDMTECPLWNIRPGLKRSLPNLKLKPEFHINAMLRAARTECSMCCDDEPQYCTSPNCNLFPWRYGMGTKRRTEESVNEIHHYDWRNSSRSKPL